MGQIAGRYQVGDLVKPFRVEPFEYPVLNLDGHPERVGHIMGRLDRAQKRRGKEMLYAFPIEPHARLARLLHALRGQRWIMNGIRMLSPSRGDDRIYPNTMPA